jgi:anti-sigma factor RsiW
VDGTLDAEAERGAAEHLAACPACAAEMAALQATLARAIALLVPEPPPAFWREFEASVRARVVAEPVPRPSPWGRVLGWAAGLPGLQPAPALVAASVLGLMLAIGLVRSERPSPSGPPVEVSMVNQDLAIGRDLDLLQQLDLLEEVEVLERLDLLRSLEDARPRVG